MGAFLIGLFVVVMIVFALNLFVQSDPRVVARSLRLVGGITGLAVAAALAYGGRWYFAVPVGVFALSLLGRPVPMASGFGARMYKSPGSASTVRAAWLEMTLDHDTGAMDGRIIKGAHAGRRLDELDVEEIFEMFADVDPESAALLEAYLDRRAPGWRESADADTGRGEGESGPVGGPMTQDEAYEILGLSPGASQADIRAAHRTLMKRLHPDRGGTTYLAAKINEAKDLLLNTHRKRS